MKRFRYAAVGVVAMAALLAQALPALGSATASSVTVVASDFNFKVSKRAVPKGVVVFKITNRGALPHDFKIAGKKTAQIAPGATAKLSVKFAKAGRYAFSCTVAGHAASGMKGSLTVR